ncbi:MAG: alpha/beta hydrolase [Armatimonadetes bacterium JP3_11]|nr:MAG: alpha/beta hydrolase [Armatimonadetes bacterium JP3_11]RMH06029.1 MAG: alpha/beta fold hydrolase [Armatimonadota bacterium]
MDRRRGVRSQTTFEGVWSGILDTGAQRLRIVFRIRRNADGTWQATLDSPDQGARGIPVSAVETAGRQITLRSEAVAGEFVGTLSEDGKRLEGLWKQGGGEWKLTLTPGEPPTRKRPQEPKPPFPYTTQEVRVPNRKAKIELAGTLTLPNGKPPFPAIVFLTGSGAQNRDEEIFEHKPFLVLADYLTRAGYATLRMDDRGVGGSGGDMSRATTLDFAEDALAAVNYLKTRREIDRKRIGLLGHSEGALVAAIAAAKAPRDVAFLILLAGTGVPGEQILYRQAELIARKSNLAEPLIQRNRALQQRVFEILKREKDDAKAQQAIYEAIVQSLGVEASQLTDAQKTTFQAQAKSYTSPWFRTFVQLDPAPYLRKVRCPVLALNGELDLQVDPDQNLPAIERALRDGGNKRITIRKLPGLNHLFQKARTGLITEYVEIEETFNPEALEMIRNWLDELGREK